ncbi:E3 ubiquitin-protein ligase RNF4 [Microtus oregoni]|uniref:E3 ubiquitin-protein ligase RNF4 n=1 Tax=Microtus oregoni TaxID=111838 RepID=UPI001BB24F51|nr:E3 ubiquitin-protein ligase RNF4 [Microtus oregoni]XP_041525547.1 E3 ubiquitin-protein ligase RNF4 [Microtus oregoni]
MSTRNPQRKRRGGTVSSRQAQKRTRETTSAPEISLETEPIELVETAGDEIVDLTCESLEPVVVDLTHNDSVVIVEERGRPRRNGRRLRQDHTDSCVVSSDDEELSRDRDVYVTTHTPRSARDEGATGLRPLGTVSCPICMDGYFEIVQSGRRIVSTECGHVFCSQCLNDSLKNANTCPTCRKKINHKRCHPIYI